MNNKKDPYIKDREIICEICAKPLMIDQYRNGRCKHCGWANDEDAHEFPNDVRYPNMVTFSRAKQLAQKGLPLKPTMEEFIKAYDFYGEMEFYYKGTRYGMITLDEIKLYIWNGPKDSIQSFKSVEDFAQKAHINGRLLKDIWNDIEDAFYIRG